MRKLVVLMGLWLIVTPAFAQDNEIGTRYWYSAYLHKKINYRWSVDNYTLLAMRSSQQNFWLAQSNLGVNYRLNRFWTVSAGYGHSLYKYTPWWEDRYPQEPNFLNTVSFHSLSLSAKRTSNVGRQFRLANKLVVQQYFPRFEKYQTRLQYSAKLSYRKSKLPLRIRPFVQGAMYYYINGVPINYYDEELEYEFTAAPNGLHRLRFKIGANFRPVKSNKKMSMTVYYGFNKEINFFGNDINTLRPSRRSERTFITYPFNDYGILGIQINYFL